MLRKCTKCGEEKEVERFVRQTGKYRPDPYRRDCKDCKNAKRRKEPRTPRKEKPKPIKNEIFGKSRTITCGQYKRWREKVLDRDRYTCTTCGSKNRLHSHHIIKWKDDETKRFDVGNGLTLCISCHMRLEGFQKGHKFSPEILKKISESQKGKIPWNKGMKKNG